MGKRSPQGTVLHPARLHECACTHTHTHRESGKGMTEDRQAQRGDKGPEVHLCQLQSPSSWAQEPFVVPSPWSTRQRGASPTSPALGPSHGAPSPSLRTLLTAAPSQRWAGVQPRAENSPTVAAEPGEKLPSQNRLRKDVFPTEELPTNTILKSRSGVDTEPSSCGRQTVGSNAGTAACHPCP